MNRNSPASTSASASASPSPGPGPRGAGALDAELKATVDAVVETCPRFRILVMGKSGAGKSSLINKAFNVELANVSHRVAGVSDINVEITSPENPRFVLHDSCGFEPGEVHNFNTVKVFVERRAREPRLEDRLHAIWMCVEIPHAGGRVLEAGDEAFLALDLGQVPVIIVFTKYDLLVNVAEMALPDALIDSLDDAALDVHARGVADAQFHAICLPPLRRVCGTAHPYVRVSIDHPETLDELIRVTREHVSEAVWLIWAVAQRGSADVSIAASIAVGRKKYWRGLASSIHFPKKTLRQCLAALHRDIVAVWNFRDPHFHLESIGFQALITRLVADLADPRPKNPNKGLTAGVAGVAGLAGVVAAMSGPAAPIVIPIAASLVLAKWAYDVYQETPGILRCLMGYIVDLTIAMQSLFWLMRAADGARARAVSRRLAQLAVRAYAGSHARARVHREIAAYVSRTGVAARAEPEHALNEVVRLIAAHRFDPTRGKEQGAVGGNEDVDEEEDAGEEDEPWDLDAADTGAGGGSEEPWDVSGVVNGVSNLVSLVT